MIRCIAAIDSRRGIADATGIPWQGSLPADVSYFRSKTAGGVVLMGFATYAELGQPLPDRRNVVAVSTARQLREGFEEAVGGRSFLESCPGDVWVIGGARLFADTLDLVGELYLTQIDRDFHCTKFFPDFANGFDRVSSSERIEEHGIPFRFEVWRREQGQLGRST